MAHMCRLLSKHLDPLLYQLLQKKRRCLTPKSVLRWEGVEAFTGTVQSIRDSRIAAKKSSAIGVKARAARRDVHDRWSSTSSTRR